MIDVEDEVYGIVYERARARFPKLFMLGERVRKPPQFPHATLVEVNNSTYERTLSSASAENHATLLYELNVYSNDSDDKKGECRAIISFIDGIMQSLGFVRIFMQPITNEDDAAVYRMVARYRTVASKEKIFYRR